MECLLFWVQTCLVIFYCFKDKSHESHRITVTELIPRLASEPLTNLTELIHPNETTAHKNLVPTQLYNFPEP